MTSPRPRAGDQITDSEALEALLRYVGMEAAPVVVTGPDGWRPFTLIESVDGDYYAWSWADEDEDAAYRDAEALPLPLTVLYVPGEQPRTDLDGAALERGPLDSWPRDAADFAARWNACTQEERDLHVANDKRLREQGMRRLVPPRTPEPVPVTVEDAFAEAEKSAMRQRTTLISPFPLLLRVRHRFVQSGGDGKAFDYAVNIYARDTSFTKVAPPAAAEPAPATIEDAARVLCSDDPTHVEKWPLVGITAYCGACYNDAQALADAGLLRTPVTAEQIEAAARALAVCRQMDWHGLTKGRRDSLRAEARAALVAAGVPVEGSQG